MGQENRRFPRLPFTVEVELYGPGGGRVRVETRDIGHGGVMLAVPEARLEVGETIELRVAGTLGGGVEPPLVRAEVVRVSDEGVAVRFLDLPADAGAEERVPD